MPRRKGKPRQVIRLNDPEGEKRKADAEKMKAQEEPNAAEIYYFSSREQRAKMLGIYLYKCVYGETRPETEKQFKDALNNERNVELLMQVAEKVKSWEAAKDMMNSPSLQGAVFGRLLGKKASKCKEDFIENQLNKIDSNEKEIAYIKQLEEVQKAKNAREEEREKKLQQVTPDEETYLKASKEERVRILKDYYRVMMVVTNQMGDKEQFEKDLESDVSNETFEKVATEFKTFRYAVKSIDNVYFYCATAGDPGGGSFREETPPKEAQSQYYEYQMVYDLEDEARELRKLQKQQVPKDKEKKKDEIKQNENKIEEKIEENKIEEKIEEIKIEEDKIEEKKEEKKDENQIGEIKIEDEKKENQNEIKIEEKIEEIKTDNKKEDLKEKQEEEKIKYEEKKNEMKQLDERLTSVMNKLENQNAKQRYDNTKHMRNLDKLAGNCFRRIYNADFFLFGLGSPEYKEMKKAIERVAEATDDYCKNAPAINPRKAAILLQEQAKAIRAVKAYLEHKYEDFNEDVFRRNDPSKQKHEQPRIAAAIDSLRDLQNSYNVLSGVVRDAETELRNQLLKKLEQEDKNRRNPNLSPIGYKHSVARSLDMISDLNGKRWCNQDPTRTVEIYDNHVADVNKTYTVGEVEKLITSVTSPIHDALEVADKLYQKNQKPLTNNDLWGIAQKQYGMKQTVDHAKSMNSNEILSLREQLIKDLVSYQVKEKAGLRKLFDSQDERAKQRDEQAAARKQQSNKQL